MTATPDQPDLATIRDNLPAHYIDCDRFQTYGYGLRSGKCDCTADADVVALIAEVERLRADNVSMTEVIQAIVPAHERACAERDEARAALARVRHALDQAENGEDPYIGRSGLIRLVPAALDRDAPHTDTTKDTQ